MIDIIVMHPESQSVYFVIDGANFSYHKMWYFRRSSPSSLPDLCFRTSVRSQHSSRLFASNHKPECVYLQRFVDGPPEYKSSTNIFNQVPCSSPTFRYADSNHRSRSRLPPCSAQILPFAGMCCSRPSENGSGTHLDNRRPLLQPKLSGRQLPRILARATSGGP